MNEVHFETMTDAQQAAEVLAMMSALNLEGEPVAGTDPSHDRLDTHCSFRTGAMNSEGHYCSSMNCSFSRRLEVAESHVSFSRFLLQAVHSGPWRWRWRLIRPTSVRRTSMSPSDLSADRIPPSHTGCLLNKAANMSERRIEARRTKRRNRDSP